MLDIIKRTLANFNIDVEMDEVSIGPSVTRYALKPAEGVKLSRIVALQNNLELNLAALLSASKRRFRANPSSASKYQTPRRRPSDSARFSVVKNSKRRTSALLIALGRGISGKSHFANLGKMPHALIAGTTGSGKSVSIHMIITSLLYRNSPAETQIHND